VEEAAPLARPVSNLEVIDETRDRLPLPGIDRGPCSAWARPVLCGVNIWRQKMPTGTVKWFNPTKGYGFIQPSGGGGKDVFVHISAVERAGLRSLNDGQTIEYEIESNRDKDSAVNLKVR
jgi:CspA family cold shock protein